MALSRGSREHGRYCRLAGHHCAGFGRHPIPSGAFRAQHWLPQPRSPCMTEKPQNWYRAERPERSGRTRAALGVFAETLPTAEWAPDFSPSSATAVRVCRALRNGHRREHVAARQRSVLPTTCRRDNRGGYCESFGSPSAIHQRHEETGPDIKWLTLHTWLRYPRSRRPVPRSGTIANPGRPAASSIGTGWGQHYKRPPSIEPTEGVLFKAVPPGYLTSGAMISAKAVRARLRRDLTVPRLTPVMSAISSYDFPSSSRRTKTSR